MDLLKLEYQVCFPLYALSRQITAAYKPLLEPLDLTYPQYLVLLVLWETREQTVGQLGKRLLLDTGTLTPLLKRLEQKELIRRTRSHEDERVVSISLTQAGEQLKERAQTVPGELMCQLKLNEEQLKQFRNTLNSLLTNIQEHESY